MSGSVVPFKDGETRFETIKLEKNRTISWLFNWSIDCGDKSKDLNTNTFLVRILRGIHEDVVDIAKIVDAYCLSRW